MFACILLGGRYQTWIRNSHRTDFVDCESELVQLWRQTTIDKVCGIWIRIHRQREPLNSGQTTWLHRNMSIVIRKPPLVRRWAIALLATILLASNGHAEPYSSASGVGIFIHGTNFGGITSLGVGSSSTTIDQKCPRVCTCTGQTVDCSHRDLQQVPRRIPLDTERL